MGPTFKLMVWGQRHVFRQVESASDPDISLGQHSSQMAQFNEEAPWNAQRATLVRKNIVLVTKMLSPFRQDLKQLIFYSATNAETGI